MIHGQGAWRYRVVPGWPKWDGVPVRNGHGLVFDRSGYLHLLTDHPETNLVTLDPATGKVQHRVQLGLTGGHGLSIVDEGPRQVLFCTCLETHRVVKTTLLGEVLAEWGWPRETGRYASAAEYKPSWTLHLPGGEFVVLDGYGKDHVIRYGADGRYLGFFGGNDGGIAHWGPHGGYVAKGELWIAMSDQRHIARWSPDGRKLGEIPLPGSDPRMLRPLGKGWVVGHIGGRWPQDFAYPGYVTIHDARFKVLSVVGGEPARTDRAGALQPLQTAADTPFRHPHDAIVGPDDALYVGQFNSGDQPLLKLERV